MLLCALLLLASCSAGSPAGLSPGPAQPGLPAPASISRPQPRAASYIESDLQKDGAGFDLGYPRAHAAADGTECVFSPAGGAAGGKLSDSAYALYGFSIDGYDRNAQIRSTWSTAPAAGRLWIGLANWASNRWDWYSASAGAPLNLPGMSDYLGGSDYCVVAVLITGSAEARLSTLRVGSHPPSIQLSASASTGMVPFTCDLDASASSDPDGTIVKYEWDLDGDDAYEISGNDATQSVLLNSAQQRIVGLRVVDNEAVSSVRHLTLRAFASWKHSWGGVGLDNLFACVYDGNNALYTCGMSTSFGAVGSDAILLKFDLAGDLQWARSVGRGDTDIAYDLCLDSDGNIILAGSSYASGNNAMLCSFNPGGEFLWGHCWQPGAGLDEVVFNCVTARAGQIYAGGSLRTMFGPGSFQDGVLAGFDAEGNLSWLRRLPGSSPQINGITTWAPLFAQPSIYATGGMNGSTVLLKVTAAGNLSSASTLTGLGVNSYGVDLVVSGATSPDIWVGALAAGLPNANNSAMLLHYTASNPECRYFNGGGDELAWGLGRRSDGSFVIAGSSTSSLAAGDGLLLNISPGLQPGDVWRLSSGSLAVDLQGLEMLGDTAALCCGKAANSDDCSWLSAGGSLHSATVQWQDLAPDWNFYSPPLDPDAILSASPLVGVLDIGGGGGSDGLLAVRALPALP